MYMKKYSVKQVADMLKTNPETVRRWIRNDKIKSNYTSDKEGYMITEDSLREFLKSKPKYAAIVAATLSMPTGALAMMIGGLVAGILNISDTNKKITDIDIEKTVENKIALLTKEINKKGEEILKLKTEIEELQKSVEKYTYILEKLDLKAIASEINESKNI